MEVKEILKDLIFNWILQKTGILSTAFINSGNV